MNISIFIVFIYHLAGKDLNKDTSVQGPVGKVAICEPPPQGPLQCTAVPQPLSEEKQSCQVKRPWTALRCFVKGHFSPKEHKKLTWKPEKQGRQRQKAPEQSRQCPRCPTLACIRPPELCSGLLRRTWDLPVNWPVTCMPGSYIVP